MKMSLYKEGKHKTVITFDYRDVDERMLHNYWAKEGKKLKLELLLSETAFDFEYWQNVYECDRA